jgi:carbonic anhydrase
MFDDLLDANREYTRVYRNSDLTGRARRGLAVLTCMDSRLDPLAMFGLQAGDAKIIRNAGARVTDDALRSLVLATNLLDVRRICVVPHTDCAMSGTSEDAMRARIEQASGESAAEWTFLTVPDQAATLRADLERIRECPLVPADVEVGGLLFDVRTGQLLPIGG